MDGNFKEGFQFILTDKLVLVTALVSTLANFITSQVESVLLPTYGNQVVNSPTALGTIFSVFSAGALIGGALYGVVGPRVSRRGVYLASWVLESVGLLGWAFLPPLYYMAAFSFLFGLAFGPMNPILNTVGMERVPKDMRSRVFGLENALGFIAAPLGPLVAGFAVEAVGLRPTFTVLAILFAVLSVLQSFSRTLREMERPSSAGSAEQVSH